MHDQITIFLKKHKQEHLLKDLSILTLNELENLLTQLIKIDQNLQSLGLPEKSLPQLDSNVKPMMKCSQIMPTDKEQGLKYLKKQIVGCLILAGGEGSRLGFFKPKGMFPIKALNNKSLFEIYVDKILLAQKKYSKKFYLAVMVSPVNSLQIISFFKKHHFFGLEENQVDFFSQNLLPFFDKDGKWFWKEKGIIAEGTDGNGGVFKNFYKSGIIKKWKQLNIEMTSILSIDNLLANPYEEALIGMHKRTNADITIWCIHFEKRKCMGGLVLVNRAIRIMEYFYLKKEATPVYFSNAGTYLINLDFIEKNHSNVLPLYKIKKPTQKWTSKGKKKSLAFKYESFIFDNFNCSKKIETFLSLKEESYAPLKNKDDIDVINQSLLKKFNSRKDS